MDTGRRARTIAVSTVGLLIAAAAVGAWRILRSTTGIPRDARQTVVTASEDSAYRQTVAQARALLSPLLVHYPGLSVAVGVEDTVRWSEGLGYADVARRVPATPATEFRAYSVAKTLTGIGLLRLHQDGRIDLDAPVGYYVPQLPAPLAAVTIRQLAGHLSGIRDYRRGEWLPLSSRSCEAPAEALTAFTHDSLISRPGSAFSYSSFNYVLLSAAIQAASGEPFGAYMNEQIVRPAGMESTRLGNAQSERPAVSTFYEPAWMGRVRVARAVDNSCKFGAGDLVTTATDLVLFGDALLAGRLLDADDMRRAFTSMQTSAGEETGYGIGWGVGQDSAGERFVAHSGGAIGGRAALLLFPDARVAVAILGNIEGDRLTGAALKIGRLFLPPPGQRLGPS